VASGARFPCLWGQRCVCVCVCVSRVVEYSSLVMHGRIPLYLGNMNINSFTFPVSVLFCLVFDSSFLFLIIRPSAASVETRCTRRYNLAFVFQNKFSTLGLKCKKFSLVSFYRFLSLLYLFFTSVLRFSPSRFSFSLLPLIFAILLLVIPSINWMFVLRLLSILLSLIFYQFFLSLLNFSLVYF